MLKDLLGTTVNVCCASLVGVGGDCLEGSTMQSDPLTLRSRQLRRWQSLKEGLKICMTMEPTSVTEFMDTHKTSGFWQPFQHKIEVPAYSANLTENPTNFCTILNSPEGPVVCPLEELPYLMYL